MTRAGERGVRAISALHRLRMHGYASDAEIVADYIGKLEAVADAAQVLTDSIEQGFASSVRPDVARMYLNRALAALGGETK